MQVNKANQSPPPAPPQFLGRGVSHQLVEAFIGFETVEDPEADREPMGESIVTKLRLEKTIEILFLNGEPASLIDALDAYLDEDVDLWREGEATLYRLERWCTYAEGQVDRDPTTTKATYE